MNDYNTDLYKIVFEKLDQKAEISLSSDFDKVCKILNESSSFLYEAIEDNFTISIYR